MFKKKLEDKIKKFVEEFFKKTSFEVLVVVEKIEDTTLPISIQLEEPQVLIGENGKTLFSIQHLLSKALRKKFKEEQDFYVDLDIDNYKKKKLDYLKDLARNSADDVALYKKEKELRPMSAYERRIIHMELKERSDVQTESVGQGLDRRIIVKPI
jgi:spoIIIJ-associated protein